MLTLIQAACTRWDRQTFSNVMHTARQAKPKPKHTNTCKSKARVSSFCFFVFSLVGLAVCVFGYVLKEEAAARHSTKLLYALTVSERSGSASGSSKAAAQLKCQPNVWLKSLNGCIAVEACKAATTFLFFVFDSLKNKSKELKNLNKIKKVSILL